MTHGRAERLEGDVLFSHTEGDTQPVPSGGPSNLQLCSRRWSLGRGLGIQEDPSWVLAVLAGAQIQVLWGQALTPGSWALTKMHQEPANGAPGKAVGGEHLASEWSGRNWERPSLSAGILGWGRQGGLERWQSPRWRKLKSDSWRVGTP